MTRYKHTTKQKMVTEGWLTDIKKLIKRLYKPYPLVNVFTYLWKDPPISMRISTISTGPFSIAM